MRRLCSILAWFCCAFCIERCSAVQTVSEPFLGVKVYHRTETSPRPLNIIVAEIDLNAPGLSFLVTPRGPAPQPVFNGVPDETVIQTTRQFVNAHGLQLGVNASFFAISDIHVVNGLSWTNNLGLTASKGDVYSPWEGLPRTDNNYDDALNITSANAASIVKMPTSGANGYTTSPSVSLYNTVTAKARLLENSANVAPVSCGSLCDLNPRTAAGLTANNSKLLLMTIDGRRTGFSEGVTLVELAGHLAEYGATNAINLDGGGSTTMAANFYDDSASAVVVNVVSGSAERSVGNNLGLFALPNGDYNKNGTVDSGDYLVWRKSIGGSYAYNAWRKRYGSTAGNGSGANESAAIPEPTSWILIAAASWALVLLRVRNRLL
jgi:Phosphodiester glycosidase